MSIRSPNIFAFGISNEVLFRMNLVSNSSCLRKGKRDNNDAKINKEKKRRRRRRRRRREKEKRYSILSPG